LTLHVDRCNQLLMERCTQVEVDDRVKTSTYRFAAVDLDVGGQGRRHRQRAFMASHAQSRALASFTDEGGRGWT
jgi:hypothetical protein